MRRSGGSLGERTFLGDRRAPLALVLLVVALLAAACTAETQLVTPVADEPAVSDSSQADPVQPDDDDNGGGADASEPPDGESEDGESADTLDSAEPTSVASVVPATAPPTDTPILIEGFLGFSPDGRFAYDSSVDPWAGAFPCGATLEEPVVGIDLARSVAAEDFVTFAGGIDNAGVASGLYFHSSGAGVLVMRCGDFPDLQETLLPVVVGPDGQLSVTGEPYPFVVVDARYQWIRGVTEPAVVEVEVTFGEDDDYENWTREIQQIDLATGVATTVAELDIEDEARIERPGFTTPDGRFIYTEIDDPAGSIGCEGYGIAASIAVDDGSGPRPIFGPDQPAWSNVSDMHFGPDGLVAWLSSCEGYPGLHVGRIMDDGTIADAHWVDPRPWDDGGEYVEFRQLRLLPDGNVVAMGLRWSEDGDPEPRFQVISLADDTGFVTTGPRRPKVATENPVADTIAGTGSWFVGESLTDDSACDSMSLFASTSGGLVHGVISPDPLGQIVDVHATPPVSFEVDYGFEPDTITRRTIVLVTECPDEYIGRKVWFGDEPEIPGYGIWFEPADLPAVANVLSVREESFDDESPWAFDVIAEVVFRDGTEAEVTLEPVPYNE